MGEFVCELPAQAVGEESHIRRQPKARLAGGNGDQDEKQC
jgi:hypothetical protein